VDAGVVVEEADAVPIGEKRAEGFALAEAEFEGEEAVGRERGLGCGDEAAVDVEAVFAGEERGVRLVGDDLGLQGGGVGEGDVGWVRDDDVEGCAGVELRCGEEIREKEMDAVAEVKALGVVARDVECRGGDVGCGDVGGGEVGGEGEGEGSGAGADVEDAWGGAVRVCADLCVDPGEDGFDEELGFGAGDEGVAGDAQG
jgi:hypothetical protein